MKLDEEGVFTLECSGRTFTANGNIIGIDELGDLYDGYDGGLCPKWEKDTDDDDFTPAERREIAEYMIKRWTAYRDSLTVDSPHG